MNFGFRRIRNFARKNSLVRLLAYALRAWPLLTGAALFLITNSLLELAVPWVTGFLLLDRVIKRADLGQLPVVVALLVGIFVAQKISDFLSDYFRALMTQRLIHTLREQRLTQALGSVSSDDVCNLVAQYRRESGRNFRTTQTTSDRILS